MPTIIAKSTDFKEQVFYIGIDVHKKSWTITVRTLDIEVGHFTQEPGAGQFRSARGLARLQLRIKDSTGQTPGLSTSI